MIVFSDEIADLNSRYGSIEQLTNVATGSNKIGQVGTSAITTSGSVTSSSATPSSVTSGSSSFEALLQQEILAVRAVVDQVNSSLAMQTSNVEAPANDIVSGLELTGLVAAFSHHNQLHV